MCGVLLALLLLLSNCSILFVRQRFFSCLCRRAWCLVWIPPKCRYRRVEPPQWAENYAEKRLRSVFQEVPAGKLLDVVLECWRRIRTHHLEQNIRIYNVAADQLLVSE